MENSICIIPCRKSRLSNRRGLSSEQLLKTVSLLTKSQMILSSGLVNRGYYIQDKDRLKEKISKVFEQSFMY